MVEHEPVSEVSGGRKVKKTLVFVDDDAVFKAFKTQMGQSASNYGQIQLPSYTNQMGPPSFLQNRRLNTALKDAGIDGEELSGAQKLTIFRMMNGDFGKDPTVIGLPDDVSKKLKQLPGKDKKYAIFSSMNLATFKGNDPKPVISAMKRDGTIMKGSYLDRFSGMVDMGNRKNPQGNEKDLEDGICEARLEEIFPSTRVSMGPRPLQGMVRDATGDYILKGIKPHSIRQGILLGTTTAEKVLGDLGHDAAIQATKVQIARQQAAEIEEQRRLQEEARRLEEVERAKTAPKLEQISEEEVEQQPQRGRRQAWVSAQQPAPIRKPPPRPGVKKEVTTPEVSEKSKNRGSRDPGDL